MELAVVPVFQSEITPRRARGFIVGTYQISLNVSLPSRECNYLSDRVQIGGLIMNLIARGTGSMESAAAYRIPFGLFFIVPTFVASCVWFIPEVRVDHSQKDELDKTNNSSRHAGSFSKTGQRTPSIRFEC